jgi:peroxiredoxin
MKLQRSIIALFVILTATATATQADQVRNVRVGEKVPPFIVRTLSGKELRSEDFRDKVMVLVYLSAEQRSSETALRDAKDVARDLRRSDLAVVTMTADVTRTDYFRALRDRIGVHHPLGLDVGREVYGSLGLIVVPTTIIVDREGRLAHVIASRKSDHPYVLRAHLRHALGLIDDEELARELTTQGVERDPPRERIARHRAAARLLREGDLLADAEKELQAALAIDAADVDTQLDLASLRLAQGRVDEAAQLVEKVAAAAPSHRRARLMTGIVLYHRDRLDEAQRVLEEALLLNPDPILTHYYLGLIHERRGDESAAIRHFKESLSRLLEDRPI